MTFFVGRERGHQSRLLLWADSERGGLERAQGVTSIPERGGLLFVRRVDSSMSERNLVEVKTLLRRSTLNDHVTIDPLTQSDDKAKQVEIIKLRSSFGNFSQPASPICTHRRLTGLQGCASAPTSPMCSYADRVHKSSHDILVNLPQAELVEIQPRDSGWFAIFTVDKTTRDAIDAFVVAGRRHFKEVRLNAGYVSPFSDPLDCEKRAGAFARVSVQVRHPSYVDSESPAPMPSLILRTPRWRRSPSTAAS